MKGVVCTKERLKALRSALNLSQQEFSERINVAQSTYAHFETGRRELRDIHISQICQAFNVSERWLRTGEGNMFEESSDSLNADLPKIAVMPQNERDAVMNFARRVAEATNRNAAEQENEALRNNPVFSEPVAETGDNTEARA